MRAITLTKPGGLDNLQLTEMAEPQPGPGEIVVKWHASSLNYHDYAVATGSLPTEDQRIPMSDGAGEIIALGEGVSQWQLGDRVMSVFFPNWQEGEATGQKIAQIAGDSIDGFAVDQSCLPATAVTKIPENYSFAEAATLPCAALTAWRGLIVEGKLSAGDTVLVQGSGGMSIFALQIAKAAGAYVYATTSSSVKAQRLKELGADVVVNYKEDENWGKTIAKLSGGGVDHVLDVGGGATLTQSINALKIGGHIALIGILGGLTAEVVLPQLFFKQLTISGLAVGSAAMQNDMVAAINANGIRPVIDKSFALESLADAFRYQESGQHFGKIVIEY